MPPRPYLQPIAGRSGLLPQILRSSRQPVCLFCSLSSGYPSAARKPRRKNEWTRRAESTAAAAGPEDVANPRRDLEQALLELQKHAANYVSLSRVQLALRGLQQEPGKESVRVAILSLANGSTGRSAKTLLRLMLADPLIPEQEWERQLEAHDIAQPLIVRIGDEPQSQPNILALKSNLLPEISVPSAVLNGNNIEVLLMEANPGVAAGQENAFQAFEEATLVPTVEIPTSSDGRYTPITTPVHKSLIVADGLLGATTAAAMPLLEDRDEIMAAVNLKINPEDAADCLFTTFDAEAGAKAVALFRQDVQNAFDFEKLWFKSNVPELLEWLKRGTLNTEDGITKKPVRTLVASVLQNAMANIQAAEAALLTGALVSRMPAASFASLNKGLADWAESAHAELQEQLDLAFTSRRWRKLRWWKLFWRVDDVSMLSSEMVSQRFLPTAEQEAIYLAGRIAESGLSNGEERPRYSLPTVASSDSVDGDQAQLINETTQTSQAGTKWPTHIPFTRRYLLNETVPALQALAQKLVLQTLSTSALTSSLAGLLYLSSYGMYEAGAVGALGLVFSLGRMQRKWETAREFWEGEVREEGRKAVRSVEASVAEVLDGAKDTTARNEQGVEDVRRARELVQKAEDALASLK